MVLVFDAGSTKTEVGSIGLGNGSIIVGGINPAVLDNERIRMLLAEVNAQLPEQKISEIYYYGAGCATEALCKKIKDNLLSIWPDADIEVASDVVGAARGLCGHDKGIACILGTGSNSALYDGENVIRNVAPLGYILGDEGSGSAIGKRLLGDIFKELAPVDIREVFFKETGLTKEKMIENVYRGEAPNKFLASYSRFASAHPEHPYIQSIMKDIFGTFIDRNISQYSEKFTYPIGFVGSIAWYFKETLEKELEVRGMKMGRLLKTPMEGLLEFHKFEK